jgi:predicted ArsR family transcriptional regulator
MENNEQYFNTTCQTGEELKKFTTKSKNQAENILEFFKKQKRAMTPYEVWVNAFDVDSVPITSVRRAMSVLTSNGSLTKTETMKEGMYGRPEYYWKLSSNTEN